MTSESDRPTDTPQDTEQGSVGEEGSVQLAAGGADGTEGSESTFAPNAFGVEKYVHGAFFLAAILAAYLAGQMLFSLWNNLADWPFAVQKLPFLISYTEEERNSASLIIGAVVGLLFVLRYYRRPSVRTWATEVAQELTQVTWPNKEAVTNGTIIVLITGVVATIFVALLDRFWGYLTNLVYGA